MLDALHPRCNNALGSALRVTVITTISWDITPVASVKQKRFLGGIEALRMHEPSKTFHVKDQTRRLQGMPTNEPRSELINLRIFDGVNDRMGIYTPQT